MPTPPRYASLLLGFLSCALFAHASAPSAQVPTQEPVRSQVFSAGDDGVNTYRIPAITITPSGALLVIAEARKESSRDASPTDLVLKRSLDGGKTWLPMQVLLKGTGTEHYMNPCIVVERETGKILLVSTHNGGSDRPGFRRHLLLTSVDEGATWAEPMELGPRTTNYEVFFVAGPGAGIQMRSGRIVIPGYGRIGPRIHGSERGLFSKVLYSDDRGETWRMGTNVSLDTNESQVVELSDGRLMLNMRQGVGARCRAIAISDDGGETWGELELVRALNEAPCQASFLRYDPPDSSRAGRILFANPDISGDRSSAVPRLKMTIRMSLDEGKTWTHKKLVHAAYSAYSGMVRLPNGDVGLVMEGGEKRYTQGIIFYRLPFAWITDSQ